MKTVIAGTDFTSSSLNACRYAAMLAKRLGSTLTLFNMFEVPLIHSNMGLYGISYNTEKRNSRINTHHVMKLLRESFPGLEIKIFVTSYNLKEELEKYSSNDKVDAVVMGLKAKGRISKFVYGSHGVNIAGKIDVPVIIVPEKYKKHKLEKVVLAVDNSQALHKFPLLSFGKFLRRSKTELDLVHVRTNEELFAPEISSLRINARKIKIETIEAKKLQDGINQYQKKKAVDLVALVSKKHSAFYNLFVESNTKKIAFSARIPVLAIHD